MRWINAHGKTSMATFVGGMGSPLVNSATTESVTAAAALAQPAAEVASFAHEVASFADEAAAAAAPAPFIGGMGSPAAAAEAAQSFAALGSPAPSGTASAAISWFAPPTHPDGSGIQWFANVASSDTFGTPTMQMGSPAADIGIGAMSVGSVFPLGSDHGWGGPDAGSFMVSDLPFTHETGFDDTPLYTAASDTPWILVADFTGDGWFFV